MKKTVLVFLGLLAGIFISVAIIFLSGYILNYFGVQLYESEFEQQRNFNLAAIFVAVTSIASGVFVCRRHA